MSQPADLPCDGAGICMICNNLPLPNDSLTCSTCDTPWHVSCLSSPPQTLPNTLQWLCPDCSILDLPVPPRSDTASGGLIASIRAIESDISLSESEKAKRRQQLMSGGVMSSQGKSDNDDDERIGSGDDVLDILGGGLNCSFCMQLPDRPVTTPCGHNFCLKCFEKWIRQGKRTCANCRNVIPSKFANQPRINSALVSVIRMAKMSKSSPAGCPPKVRHFVHNGNRPDKAYTTEHAKKPGKSNACSGKIFVTVPSDHFGPILAENDPVRSQGVLVGESWEDRLECRQWGAHFPHVAGIAGQSAYGAQSVALSGGYIDDEDHGDWFLYTGSGGRDLSGNKRTSKSQSFDQKFEKMNEALRVSCLKGYPVRVVRSHKEKRSSYAPETGVRYDGIYRIEKCWRKKGVQGFKVCRYLFVRCDNEPAPWTSDDHGDRPRPLPIISELANASDVTERRRFPSWDYDDEKRCWIWKKPAPHSRKKVSGENPEDGYKIRRIKRKAQTVAVREKLLKELSCQICRKVMSNPLTTPCAHNFCKACLENAFAGQSFTRLRTCEGRRTLRMKKNVMKCPSCTNDISDFLQNPQVNRELMGVIESLQQKNDESENFDDSTEESNGTHEYAERVVDLELNNVNDGTPENAEDHTMEQPDAVNVDIGIDINKCEIADSEEQGHAEVKQIRRRKKANGGGSQLMVDAEGQTRGKRARGTVPLDASGN